MIEIELPNGSILELDLPENTAPHLVQRAVDDAISKNPTLKNIVSDTRAEDARKFAEETAEGPLGLLRTGAIKTGEGLFKLGRALGIADDQTSSEKLALDLLEEERPITSTVGEIVGEALPFAAVPVGAIAGTGARVAASTGLGAIEGALIRRGEGASGLEQLEGAGVGGTIAGIFEAALPHIGRLGGKLIRKVTGKAPRGALITAEGLPSVEFKNALDASEMTFEDITDASIDVLKQRERAVPGQAAREAELTDLGFKPTTGDITQQFAQQAEEARLFDATADISADEVRNIRLQQSENFTDQLETLIGESGIPDQTGSSIKDALSGRKNLLKTEKNNLYKKAFKEADNIVAIPLQTDVLEEVLPDARTLRRIGTLDPQRTDAFLDLVAEYGIDKSDDALARLKNKNIVPEVLTVQNHDEFRVALNQIMNVPPTEANRIAVLAGPVKNALDSETDSMGKILEDIGEKNLAESFGRARESVIQLKKEFDPDDIVEKLIKKKGKGQNVDFIEASKAYKNILGPNTPPEFLDRTLKSLSKSGVQGKEAIGNMQASAVFDLMESAFKAETRKVSGKKLLGNVAFIKRYEQIGPEKFKRLFANNPDGLKKINRLVKAARTLTPPSGAVPKGSASVLMDLALNTIGGIKGMGTIAGGVRAFSKLGGNSQAVRNALVAKPELRRIATELESEIPSILSALGVIGGLELLEENNNGQ